MKILKNLTKQKGQSVMEYVILSSLIGIICLAAVRDFGKVVETRIDRMRSRVTEVIDL